MIIFTSMGDSQEKQRMLMKILFEATDNPQSISSFESLRSWGTQHPTCVKLQYIMLQTFSFYQPETLKIRYVTNKNVQHVK